VGTPEGLRQRGVRLGLLRPFQEPIEPVVLHGGVRQPDEDQGLPPAQGATLLSVPRFDSRLDALDGPTCVGDRFVVTASRLCTSWRCPAV
jgi:hypothetical protein